MGVISAIFVVLITILMPPAGVFAISGCSVDFFVNICLTLLGYLPGHIHAFYLEYVYYDRKEQNRLGRFAARPAPGVYSDRIQSGGHGYGTIPNTSSTSLAPSTAEGRPIPLDDTTAAHRTSALQKLNSTYPSAVRRHRYAKSTGAQSSTYSQPVLVRTYSGPSPSQASHGSVTPARHRPSSSSRGLSRRVPLPLSTSRSGATLASKPIQPALSGVRSGSSSNNGNSTGKNGSSASRLSMPRHKAKKPSNKLPVPLHLPLPLPLSWQWQSAPEPDEPKLPPLEAFSFKSFMADMQEHGGENDIGADLDRIAEICARSRYSLSNQYEVHVAPHGSGTSFSAGLGSSGIRRRGHSRSHSGGGPTLQAIGSDDDDSASRSHRKRRSGARRRSVAYGTLETIMSSSRSSEEDKTKKKSAAEIAGEVRGRAARKAWDHSTESNSGSRSTANAEAGSHGTPTEGSHDGQQGHRSKLGRKKSASFATAIMDSGRSAGHRDTTSTRSPASALVSEPALPQTSNSHLGVRTAPSDPSFGSNGVPQSSQPASPRIVDPDRLEVHFADDLPHQEDARSSTGSLLGWGTWIPWRTQQRNEASGGPPYQYARVSPSHAEGSLRQLLKSVDVASDKGKAVEH
ncbi:hypothetical protein B0T24DRAFT_679406 [Lasiosphaeria ovina]|uniref:Stress response RCI peptide n=1 Tax=Lasiosphaeria ovina TaxID=92902 RepID=A0AAE0KCL7_9PEZI|nr:hypothetical protein B0T24DRAFT_679406 [Lasiosphaeria ovina]